MVVFITEHSVSGCYVPKSSSAVSKSHNSLSFTYRSQSLEFFTEARMNVGAVSRVSTDHEEPVGLAAAL